MHWAACMVEPLMLMKALQAHANNPASLRPGSQETGGEKPLFHIIEDVWLSFVCHKTWLLFGTD
jgi:hypothetical protein